MASAVEAGQSCSGYGGQTASLPFSKAVEMVQSVFVSDVTKPMWIGLNDKQAEGTFAWENGESYDDTLYANWASSEPANSESKDCVVLDTDFKWQMVDCSSSNSYGHLCMKGGSFGEY